MQRLMIDEGDRNNANLVPKRRLVAALLGCASLLSTTTALAELPQTAPSATAPSATAASSEALAASTTPPSGVPASDLAAPPPTHVEAPDLAAGAAVQADYRPVPAAKIRPLDEEKSQPQEEWYGWQNLIVDGSVVGMLVVSAATEADELASIGLLGYLVGSPIVHWSHGKVGAGFGSLGMRAAAFGTLLIGTAACVSGALSGDSSSGVCGVAVVGLVAMPAAIAIDAAVLAYEEVPPEQTVSTHLLPWVNKERGAVGVNWVGRF